MKFEDMEWEDVGYGLLILVALIGLTLLTMVLASPHKVDGYYFSHQNASTATCVYAHWTWHQDEAAFCTNDYQEALDFAARANAQLK